MTNNRPVIYYQTDPRWKSIRYATSAENATIGGSGCGPTSAAMVIATWADKSVTPVTTCKWSMAHGYKATGAGTYHSYFVPQFKAYGLQCTKLNDTSVQYMSKTDAEKYHKKAWNAVEDGNLVICLMGKGNWTRGGHYILWYSNHGNNVVINDPASSAAHRHENSFSLLKQSVRIYWVIKPPKEVISMTNSEVKALIRSEVKANMASSSSIKQAATTAATEAANKAIEKYINDLNNAPESDWSKEEGSFKKTQTIKAKNGKTIMDGSSPRGYITREQVAAIIDRLGLLDKE